MFPFLGPRTSIRVPSSSAQILHLSTWNYQNSLSSLSYLGLVVCATLTYGPARGHQPRCQSRFGLPPCYSRRSHPVSEAGSRFRNRHRCRIRYHHRICSHLNQSYRYRRETESLRFSSLVRSATAPWSCVPLCTISLNCSNCAITYSC
jgi:hypothetical protein